MGIRRPPTVVFGALVDPAITTRFWFTDSSGPMEPGAHLRWRWEMFGAEAEVVVTAFEPDRRIAFDWGGGGVFRSVEFRFVPWGDDATHVEVSESGFEGTGDEAVAWLADSTGGFTNMLSALKAFLEHDTVLTVVADHHPADLGG